MKSALQKFRIAIWALMSLVACDSKEPMTSDEAANWVANMKCSFVLIIVLGVLCGCVRPKKADSSGAESIDMPESKIDTLVSVEAASDSLQVAKNAIYYWKTVFRLTEYDRQFLKKHHIRKIYLRMFDVDRVENADGDLEVIPIATTLFQDTIPAGIEIVPTVYITTKAIRHDSDFAELMYKRIHAMLMRHQIRNVQEIQVDCDWTASTQDSFFGFCQKLRNLLHADSLSLSATIRLHQLKKKVPPVDKGVLMLYNTGSIYNPETKNSILSYKDVEAYLKSNITYGLPLDFAYPTYSWGILMEERNYRVILHEMNFSDTLRYKKMTGGNYLVLQEHYLENHHIRKGNIIRLENSTFSEIMRVKRLIAFKMASESGNTVLYHLDSLNLSMFEEKEINQIYTPIP